MVVADIHARKVGYATGCKNYNTATVAVHKCVGANLRGVMRDRRGKTLQRKYERNRRSHEDPLVPIDGARLDARLEELHHVRQLALADVAEKVNLHKSQLLRLRRGEIRRCRRSVFRALTRVLGVSGAYLAGDPSAAPGVVGELVAIQAAEANAVDPTARIRPTESKPAFVRASSHPRSSRDEVELLSPREELEFDAVFRMLQTVSGQSDRDATVRLARVTEALTDLRGWRAWLAGTGDLPRATPEECVEFARAVRAILEVTLRPFLDAPERMGMRGVGILEATWEDLPRGRLGPVLLRDTGDSLIPLLPVLPHDPWVDPPSSNADARRRNPRRKGRSA